MYTIKDTRDPYYLQIGLAVGANEALPAVLPPRPMLDPRCFLTGECLGDGSVVRGARPGGRDLLALVTVTDKSALLGVSTAGT